MAALTPLNQVTGVRLPVIMAACEGIWGIKMAQAMQMLNGAVDPDMTTFSLYNWSRPDIVRNHSKPTDTSATRFVSREIAWY